MRLRRLVKRSAPMLGRLLAAVLTLAAGLPGPLELRHEHEGGGRGHVHPRHAVAHGSHGHDHDHRHPHTHSHDHSNPHDRGPSLSAPDSTHSHAFDPFQRVAQSAAPSWTTTSALIARPAPAPPDAPHGFDLVRRSRGPPRLAG